MNIYWSLKSVPELAPLSGQQRRRVHEQCLRRYFVRAQATTRSVLAYIAALSIATFFACLGFSIAAGPGIVRGVWVIVSASIGFAAGRFILSRVAIPVLRPFYREFIEKLLNEHDA